MPEVPDVSATEVAERLGSVELLKPTPEVLRTTLMVAVDTARYWQEPDGEDHLAVTPEMQPALERVARHVAASPFTAWWCAPVDRYAQYSVLWDAATRRELPNDIHALLRAASDRERANERLAQKKRDPDPTANWSGDWWSTPTRIMPSSARVLSDGSPAGLWFVEDSLGWEHAETTKISVSDDVSALEIKDASDWAELCARFPLEVTAQKRHDWYRTTKHTGRWVAPDWAQVAEHYDGVHLQVGAYLSAAGTAIPIDNSTATASVIAGWNPDETYWFSSDIDYDSEHTRWERADADANIVWAPA